MMLVSFLSGGFVDEAVDNRANDQGYKNVYFLWYHTFTGISFINGDQVC